jgi:hypothetical protein
LQRNTQKGTNLFLLLWHILIVKKLPHHPIKSWRTHFAALSQNEFENWRKRSGIAYRKAKNAKEPQSQSQTISEPPIHTVPDVEYQGNPAPWDTPSTPSAPPVNGVSPEDPNRALEEDLNTIAHFFAGGGDDQSEEEDVIWARLTAKVCEFKISSWSLTSDLL